MKFRTSYDSTQHKASPSGSRFRKKYIRSYADDGTPQLISEGIEDVYDSIQKAKPGNVIEDLIRRAQSGDTTAIREPIDSYADISGMPTDILEAHQMLIKAKDNYYKLPSDLRAKYGNNFTGFLNAMSDGSLAKDLVTPNAKEAVAPLSAAEIKKFRESLTNGGTNNE